MEEFRQGPSAGWYWRQVLIAIFTSCSAKLRVLWVAAGFTIVWICIIDASSRWLLYISRGRLFQTIFSWGVTLAWPASEIYAITFFVGLAALPLLVSLSIYLGAMRRFNLRGLSRRLVVGMVGFTFSYVALMLLPTPLRGFAGGFAGHVIGSLPLFVGLMLSLWSIQPTAKGVGVTRISA